jgi:VWFA-related protein
MKNTLTLTLAVVLASAPAVLAAAQSDAPRTVKSSVESLAADVEVLVLDSKGHPVEGLAKSDFRLLVNGKETPIDWLEAPAGSAPLAAPASGPAAQVGVGASAPVSPNRRVHSTVFVISDLHTDVRSRNAGLKALVSHAERMAAGEEAAVYLLDNGVRRLQAFTTDRAAVVKALERSAKALPRSYAFSDTGSDEWVGQSRQMLRNFTTVLDSLANRPETKTVVVLTGPVSPTGFITRVGADTTPVSRPGVTLLNPAPIPGDDRATFPGPYTSYSGPGLWNFLGEAKDAESQALLAHATIVAIDPAGVDSPGARAETTDQSTSRIRHGNREALRPFDSSTASDKTDTWEFQNDTFALIAASTGGERLGFSNEPGALLAAETKLLASRYRLGFTPPDGTSARRGIRVEVARPGVVVRAAAGQRSLTPETAARARFASLLLSADSPRGDFAIAIETKGPVKKRTDDAFPFDVLVPVSGVYSEEIADGKRAKLELLIAGVDEEGRASDPMVIPFSVTLEKSAADGTFFRKNSNFTLDRKWKGRLFVGVRDTSTNRIGAVALPIGM